MHKRHRFFHFDISEHFCAIFSAIGADSLDGIDLRLLCKFEKDLKINLRQLEDGGKLMIRPGILLSCFMVYATAAPLQAQLPAGVSALSSRQLLIINPEPQVLLAPNYKLQPLIPAARIESSPGQTVVLYPSLPPSGDKAALRQWSQMLTMQIEQIFQQFVQGQQPSVTEGEDDDDDREDCTNGCGPAVNLNPNNNRRFYTVAGRPQFFGNFDFLQNPGNPLFSLQPLEPIKARSVIDPIKEISEEKVSVPSIPASESLPSSLPLRISETEEKDEANAANKPGMAARQFAQFLIEQRVLHPEHAVGSRQVHGVAAQEFIQLLEQAKKEMPIDNGKIEDSASPAKDDTEGEADPSIAQAAPIGVAVTGKGGLSQAIPIATAIVGKKGLAVSRPAATAVAGVFEDSGKFDTGKTKTS